MHAHHHRLLLWILAALLTGCATPELRNSLDMAFVRIPPGSFNMGNGESVDSLAAAYPDVKEKNAALLRKAQGRHD